MFYISARTLSGALLGISGLVSLGAAQTLATLNPKPLAAGSKMITGSSPYAKGKFSVSVNGANVKTDCVGASTGACVLAADGSFTITLDTALAINQFVEITLRSDHSRTLSWSGTVQSFGLTFSPVRIKVGDTTASGGLTSTGSFDWTTLDHVTLEVLSGTDLIGDPMPVNWDATQHRASKTGLTAFAENQRVHFHFYDKTGSEIEVTGGTVTVHSKCDLTFSPVQIKEGATSASGGLACTAAFDWTTVDHATLEVLSGNEPIGDPVDANWDPKQHRASKTGLAALSEDQSVHFHFYDKSGTEIKVTGGAVTVQSNGYDWGRAKAYFSLGALWTRENGSFGTPTGYVGLNVDWNVLTRDSGLIFDRQKPRPRSSCFSKNDDKTGFKDWNDANGGCTPKLRYMLNTYFESRLTEIPINTSGDSSGGSNSANPSASAKADASGTAPATGLGTADISQFKGFNVEGGIYAPIIPAQLQWNYHGQDNAFFFGPLAKVGFSAPSSSNDTNNTVFQFFGFGMRIGHYKMPADATKESPELLSYLDFTGGKWDNLIYAGSPRTRFDVTGRLKVPVTPFYVGFEANVGAGPDDLRIFVGTRIDIGSLLGKLVPSSK